MRYDAGQVKYRKYAKGLLRSDGKEGFNTPSAKIELVSSLLQQYGYNGLPVYVEPIEGPLGSPELFERYPLVLNTGARLQSAFRSQHLNIPGLLKLQPRPQVLINPVDAKARGISDANRVWVESPRGKVGVRAKVTDDVMAGQVELNVGGGAPFTRRNATRTPTSTLTSKTQSDFRFSCHKALLATAASSVVGQICITSSHASP
jgi:anaerobic selenocysteine-containing dehydrogenase